MTEKDSKQTLADLLHEATGQCSKGTKKILAKCQKAALNGKSSIKVKCTEADYKYARSSKYDSDRAPITPLIESLKDNGFHIDYDYQPGVFFSPTYYLIISW